MQWCQAIAQSKLSKAEQRVREGCGRGAEGLREGCGRGAGGCGRGAGWFRGGAGGVRDS